METVEIPTANMSRLKREERFKSIFYLTITNNNFHKQIDRINFCVCSVTHILLPCTCVSPTVKVITYCSINNSLWNPMHGSDLIRPDMINAKFLLMLFGRICSSIVTTGIYDGPEKITKMFFPSSLST